MAMKLPTRFVEKPWGRCALPPMFDAPEGEPLGEVWFAGPEDLPLLVKYIFTSERLSIQVHPNDEQARERGLRQGKNECWYILEAEPGAELGLGLKEAIARDELRAAALDGSIETLIDWRPVRPGDFFMVPAGTVHAIGAGISLLEFQQNADVTYRLYDYGRPRELHLDDGIAVSLAEPYPERLAQSVDPEASVVLVDGPAFSLVQVVGDARGAEKLAERQRWVMPLDGSVAGGGVEAGSGECLLLDHGDPLVLTEGRALVGAAGALECR